MKCNTCLWRQDLVINKSIYKYFIKYVGIFISKGKKEQKRLRIFIHLNQFIVFSKSFLTMIISYKQTDRINLQNRITYIPSFPDLRPKHVKKKMLIDQGYICIKLSISNRSRVDNIFLIIGPSPKSESEGRTSIYNLSVAYPSHVF